MLSKLVAKARVLEVDDDQAVADSYGALLQCLGVDVRVAHSGEAALAIIPEFKPQLVLLDISMPHMDGMRQRGEFTIYRNEKAFSLRRLHR